MEGNKGGSASDALWAYAEQHSWDDSTQMEIVVSYCAVPVEVLLDYLDETGQADDFVDYLQDNFGEDSD